MAIATKIKETLDRELKAIGVTLEIIGLEHPSDLKNGDYSSNVAFTAMRLLAETMGTHVHDAHWSRFNGSNPKDLATYLKEKVEGTIEGIKKVEVAGAGFINFYLAPTALAASIEAARAEDMWGSNATLTGKKIMVEYTDPNPFKEFHIGHLMSNAIGESIARLLQFSGAEVKRANYQGDVGPHVAKTIWAVKNKKVAGANWGAAYVVGNQAYESEEEAKKEIDEINTKIYDRSDSAINEMYDAGRKASLAHFEELYKILGTKFDHYFFESETGPRGIKLVKAHPQVFEQSDGAVVYKGEKVGLHTRVFVTSKGLPTYETKDLGLAELKTETWEFDESITVTANEQNDYFKVVLAAMKEILPEIAAKINHVSHGMMRFAEGKMSSRTGNVVTGESLLDDLVDAAKIRAKESRTTDAGKLSEEIAVAAIKYQILKQASGKDIIFDRERALSLEGDSGPYLQYAHARAHQLIEKAREQNVVPKIDQNVEPNDLVRLLHRFPEAVEYAAAHNEPHLLTNYLLEFAALFNSWYAQVHVLDGTPEAAHKVALVDAVRRTLKNGLWVLGIPAPERM